MVFDKVVYFTCEIIITTLESRLANEENLKEMTRLQEEEKARIH